MTESSTEARRAPWYPISSRRIVAVEHPGIVKNVNRAIDTLHGESGLAQVSLKHLKYPLDSWKKKILLLTQLDRFWTLPNLIQGLVWLFDQRISWPTLSSRLIDRVIISSWKSPSRNGRGESAKEVVTSRSPTASRRRTKLKSKDRAAIFDCEVYKIMLKSTRSKRWGPWRGRTTFGVYLIMCFRRPGVHLRKSFETWFFPLIVSVTIVFVLASCKLSFLTPD